MELCKLCNKGKLVQKSVRNYEYHTPMGIVTIQGLSKFTECQNCHNVLIPGSVIDDWNRLILTRLSEKQGIYSPAEVQFIFSTLPFSQNEIAKAMGKDRSTLTKYKTGENPLDPLFVDALQQMIVDHLQGKEDTIDRLRNRFVFHDEAITKVRYH